MTTMKEFGQRLAAGVSRAAETIGLGRLVPKQPTWKVTGHCGLKGGLYRRTIGYKRTGPFYEQVGWLADGKPQMRQVFVHRFLHATKGYRVKRTTNPTVGLSNAVQPRVYGPRAGAYIDHGRFVFAQERRIEGSAGSVLVPYFRVDKTKAGASNYGMHKLPRAA